MGSGDFTLCLYSELIDALLESGRDFYSARGYQENHPERGVILRHDIDLLPFHALDTALLERHARVCGTYYFRINPTCCPPEVIQRVRDAGHEIGYHYEDLIFARGDRDLAYRSFCRNLEYLRKFYPVTTACVHKNPDSRWDSLHIWKKYNYRKLGITFEPYLDLDFSSVFYLTDTGRNRECRKMSRQGKVLLKKAGISKNVKFHTPREIISAARNESLPPLIMLHVHPQLWTERYAP